MAAENGNLKCLRYAHENGCPWDPDTTCAAAANGELKCLRYAHENGCPWHPDTTWVAAQNGELKCLRYIYEKCNITWEDAKLKRISTYPKKCRKFIRSVRDDWKSGLNSVGKNTKSAR
uniref:Ankyrin repeat protein n=1 Tax=Marseillevirus LCMAC101 TaxID=2506602 RepID=A0A481YSY3_9VIRU|nr:MAG: ankyrin repeat protein [Marseillevirus LCMAC101]